MEAAAAGGLRPFSELLPEPVYQNNRRAWRTIGGPGPTRVVVAYSGNGKDAKQAAQACCEARRLEPGIPVTRQG
jgi:hypothetical protein